MSKIALRLCLGVMQCIVALSSPALADGPDHVWRAIGPPGRPTSVSLMGIDQDGNLLIYPGYSGIYRLNGNSCLPFGFGQSAKFAGVDTKGRRYVSASAGMYWSTNQGSTWEYVPFSLPNQVAFDPAGYIFAATNDGIFRSDSIGIIWQKTSFQGWNVGNILVNARGDIFAATWSFGDGSVFKSTDKGATWLSKNNGIPGTDKEIAAMLQDKHGVLYVGSWKNNLYRSTDNGESWTYLQSIPGWAEFITYDSTHDLLYANQAGNGIVKSSDQGVSWTALPGTAGPYSGLLVTPDGTLYSAWWNYLRRYSGASWDSLSLTGLPTGSVKALAVDKDDGLLVSTELDIERSTDAGATWDVFSGGFSPDRLFCLNNGFDFAISGWPQTLYRSTDNGGQWVPLLSLSGEGNIILAAGPDQTIYAGTPFGVLHSGNGGTTWDTSTSLLSPRALAVFPDGRLLAATYADVYMSTNQGSTWSPLGLQVPVSSMAIDSSGTICSGSPWGAFRSLDGGSVWSQTYFRGLEFNALIGSRDGSFIASVLSAGVYRSTNQGMDWEATGSEFPDDNCTALAEDHYGRRFAGTDGHGVLLLTPVMGVQQNTPAGVPSVFALEQNYPNPFNPTTLIRYSIPVETYNCTSLRVYDLLGREVAVLVNERKAPGTYSVQFDASSLASGVYFYRLITGTFAETRKMTVVR